MTRIIISGYYGFGNTGDEAVLSGICETFRQIGLDAEITVISQDPERTIREHTGVKAISRKKLIHQMKALAKADLYISGGGSLFQDATSARSAYYYLTGLQMARIARCRTMIYAQGVGPLIRHSIRRAVAKAFNRADLVSVRDGGSVHLLKEIGVRKDIHLCADPAFLVEPDYETADAIIESNGLTGKSLVGVSLRPWPASHDWISRIAHLATELCDKIGAQVVFIPMQESVDAKIGEGPTLKHGGDPAVAKGLLARCELVVGMRLHALIFAVGAGAPCMPVVYDPKVSAFANDVGLDISSTIGADEDSFTQAFLAAWENRETIARRLAGESALRKQQALSCGELAASLLEH